MSAFCDSTSTTTSDRLTGIDPDRAECVAVGLVASSTAGIAQWCVEAATAHLRTREQFGKVIGTFQALQHNAAMLLVNSELATAAAWDAVRAVDEPLDQHRLAAAGAAVIAVSPTPDLVLDALTLFGAIGYTWEHDIHLYWRRATSLAASIGVASRWARRLGEMTCSQQRDMSVDLGDAESDFRAQVAETLDSARELRNDRPGRQGAYEYLRTGAATRPDRRGGPDRAALAATVGNRRRSTAAAHHQRGIRQATRSGPSLAEHRRMDPALSDARRAKGTAGESDSAYAARRDRLVPAVQRAGSGF